MKYVNYIVYRYLTAAEFFNMYKPRGTEPGGGGQMYVDFPGRAVGIVQWRDFFSDVRGIVEKQGKRGPRWTLPVFSIGLPQSKTQQTIVMYQRRSASVCVAAQHIHARGANRVLSWHPDHGFPQPEHPTDRHQLPEGLAVYFVRTYDNEVWAGWFRNHPDFPTPCASVAAGNLLRERQMLRGNVPGKAGFLAFRSGRLFLDETNQQSPLTTLGATRPGRPQRRRQLTDQEIVKRLFDEDEETEIRREGETREVRLAVRCRNERAIRYLKELYQQCQISGTNYLFKKRDGSLYMEAHHLVSLSGGGGDDPRNIIIVSPLIHKMLHYADVSEIDLSRIRETKDGWATLEIQISGVNHTIKWHPMHARKVLEQQEVGPD